MWTIENYSRSISKRVWRSTPRDRGVSDSSHRLFGPNGLVDQKVVHQDVLLRTLGRLGDSIGSPGGGGVEGAAAPVPHALFFNFVYEEVSDTEQRHHDGPRNIDWKHWMGLRKVGVMWGPEEGHLGTTKLCWKEGQQEVMHHFLAEVTISVIS